MIEVTAKKWGNGIGILLNREARELLGGIGENDKLYLTRSPDGLRITPHDPEFARQMELAEEGMRAYRNTLRALAK